MSVRKNHGLAPQPMAGIGGAKAADLIVSWSNPPAQCMTLALANAHRILNPPIENMKKSILNPTSQAIAGEPAMLALISIEGGVWACAPVAESPELELRAWHVFEVQLPDRAERTRHFAGYNTTDGEGRASSAIVTFDSATRRGITQSGRVYELLGSTSLSLDGEYVWKAWLRINAATDVVDVTPEIKALIASQK